MSNLLLKAEKVSKSFFKGKKEVQVVRGVNLAIEAVERVEIGRAHV